MYVDVTTRINLEEVTVGVVVAKIGIPPSLAQPHDNYFIHCMDQYYHDSATGKAVYEGQKPLSLFEEFIELYTTPEDWVFSSPTGISMYVLHNIIIFA